MIPVEFSYFRTIFGKTGQGSYLSCLPGKYRELLSYLSVHFFMDKEEQVVFNRFQPVFIPAGNTIIWELKREMVQEYGNDYLSNSLTNTLFKLFKSLSINTIAKNVFLTYYAGEVEIADEDQTNGNVTLPSNHVLIAGAGSKDSSTYDWSFDDPVQGKVLAVDLEENPGRPCFSFTRKGRAFSTSGMYERINRRIYFLFHHHFDRISPPGYIHRYQLICARSHSDYGIRAGPW
jgi:hypothetical protein